MIDEHQKDIIKYTTCVTSSKLVAMPPLGTGMPKLRITSIETFKILNNNFNSRCFFPLSELVIYAAYYNITMGQYEFLDNFSHIHAR